MTREQIDAICPGWSTEHHWNFFGCCIRETPVRRIFRVLMLGVYMGRDIAYIGELARQNNRPIEITGVDLFSDTPGADWLPSQKDMTWQQAHGIAAPTMQSARDKIQACGVVAKLIEGDALEFLNRSQVWWDLIYIDISHDYNTTAKAISLAKPRLFKGGIIAGDDYMDSGTWGVKSAVDERFPVVETYGPIWKGIL